MRYALGIEYNGSGFHGWQSQRDDLSVQVCLEQAISRVADHAVTVICAGRTDTGVHALCQVVHFDTEVHRTMRQWILGINSHLPATICVRWVQSVTEAFHARFSALERQYRYILVNRWTRPAVQHELKGWCRHPLDVALMNDAAVFLMGEHDFSAFRSAGCTARHAVREVNRISVRRQSGEVILDISANGFLYHMVRNILGSLLEVGRGREPVSWIADLLDSKDRKRAGVTAPAQGLYFIGVRYPANFGIPENPDDFPLDSNHP